MSEFQQPIESPAISPVVSERRLKPSRFVVANLLAIEMILAAYSVVRLSDHLADTDPAVVALDSRVTDPAPDPLAAELEVQKQLVEDAARNAEVHEAQAEELEGTVLDLATIIAAQQNISVETVLRDLDKPEDLAGYGQSVSIETREQLHDSVVKIGSRLKGTSDSWAQVCTGNKVLIDGVVYIATASHCFRTDTPPYDFDQEYYPVAADITDISYYEYAILDAKDEPLDRDVLTAVSQVTTHLTSDIALLTPQDPSQLNGVTAISTQDYEGSSTPQVGTEVALSSLPQSNGDDFTEETGIYLGRIEGYGVGSNSQLLDIVGISNVSAAETDPCQYGGSGSGSLAGDDLPLGPLSIRHQVQEYEDGYFNVYESEKMALVSTLKFEDLLGTDVSEFTILCGYAVVFDTDILDLQTAPTPIEVDLYDYTLEESGK